MHYSIIRTIWGYRVHDSRSNSYVTEPVAWRWLAAVYQGFLMYGEYPQFML